MYQDRASERGITLLEILVAVAIIAFVSGAVILSLPPQTRPLQVEAAKLENTFEALSDRAIITGKVHALEMTRGGYFGQSLENGEWVDLASPRENFPRNMSVRPSTDIAASDESDWRILFSPTGVKGTGSIRLSDPSGSRDIFVAGSEGEGG